MSYLRRVVPLGVLLAALCAPLACGPLVGVGAIAIVAGSSGGGGGGGGGQTIAFTEKQKVPVDPDLDAVWAKIADVTGDGRNELLVGVEPRPGSSFPSPQPRLLIYSFDAAPPTLLATLRFGGDPIFTIEVGDLNLDGRPDIVTRASGNNGIVVLRNDSASSVTFTALPPIALQGIRMGFALVDVDGDGRRDVVTCLEGNGGPQGVVEMLRNVTPPGSSAIAFDPPVQILAPAAAPFVIGGYNTVARADLDRDGRPDLVVSRGATAAGTDGVVALLNRTPPGGAVTFTAVDLGYALATFAVTDLDGDGADDLVVYQYRNDDYGFPERSEARLNQTPPGSATLVFAAPAKISTPFAPIACERFDIDGDGREDILDGGCLGFRLNRTAPGSSAPRLDGTVVRAMTNLPRGASPLTVGDLDGDGRPDLAFQASEPVSGANDIGEVFVTFNHTSPFGTGGPSFAAPFTPAPPPSQAPAAIALADLNQDARPDLVAAGRDGAISLYANETPVGAKAADFDRTLADLAAGGTLTALVVADLDHEGPPEIAVAREDGQVLVYRNTTIAGSAALSFDAPIAITTPAGARALAAADLNLDGRVDLVVSSATDGSFTVLLSDAPAGALSFTTTTISTGSRTPDVLAIADFDRDGVPDLALLDVHSSAHLSLWRNTTPPGSGAASFESPFDLGGFAGELASSIAIADWFHEGRPGCLTARTDVAEVDFRFNTAPRGSPFFSNSEVGIGKLPVDAQGHERRISVMTVADLDNDGHVDLLVGTLGGDGAVFLGYEGSAGKNSEEIRISFSNGGRIDALAVADINRDGRPDVVTSSSSGFAGFLAVRLQK